MKPQLLDDSKFRDGVIIGFMANAFQIVLFTFVKTNTISPMLLFGVTQLVYMIPTIIVFLALRKFNACKGLAVIAGLTFLLNIVYCGSQMR